MIPIKYIENNLIKNVNGDWWAYYRIEPYNYSFSNDDEKIQCFYRLRQLIAQTGKGNVHMLEIGAEQSVIASQEKSKEFAVGRLAEVAKEAIDVQTQTLVEGVWVNRPKYKIPDSIQPFHIGATQVDYQCYIGFKLVPSDSFSIKNVLRNAVDVVENFFSDVGKGMMNEYVLVSDKEFERFLQLEHLTYNKISRLFNVHKLHASDIAYIVEHIYGYSGTALEDYSYPVTYERHGDGVIVKEYDFLKLSDSLITERPKHIIYEPENEKVYCAYMTISDIVGELSFPGCEILYKQKELFHFPIDTSIKIDVLENKKALSKVRGKSKELKDMDNHAYKSGHETSGNIIDALEIVNELETDLQTTKDDMYVMSYLIRVTASSKKELDNRCNYIKDIFDDYNIKIVRPAGDMFDFHTEFMPSARRMNTLTKHVLSDFFACLGFGAAQIIGEKSGIAIGHTKYSNKLFYLQPWLAAQGIEGSDTNSLSVGYFGSLGGGKSFLKNLNIYYSTLFGAQTVIIDPKSERTDWKENLPEIAHEISIINLTTDEENRGILDPFILLKNKKDSESLALDILTYLLGVTIKDNERYPALRKAVRAVSNSNDSCMFNIIGELKAENTEISNSLAVHIESFVDFGLSQLLFSDGNVTNSITLEKRLNIIQVADLVLPDTETDPVDYTATEMLSVAMMIVMSTFCLDFIRSDTTTFKIVALDEAWSILNVSQGKILSNKLMRAGRAMNGALYMSTQSAFDVDEIVRNNLGMIFVFRSKSIHEIKKSLELLGVDSESVENQNMILNLKNGQCVMRDIYGRVNVVNIIFLQPHLFKAFDTRPESEIRKAV